ncbi:MAG: protein-glutamate O-methyltransferase CheR [bacterium]
MKNLIENIGNLYRTKYDKNISIYDDTFLKQSLHSRMNFSNCDNYLDYFNLINSSESESVAFLNSLNNSYSEFFRNPLTFALLEQHLLPMILQNKNNYKTGDLRIWSAGCSIGQEPYSLAILLEDIFQENRDNLSYRIFATDISTNELSIAKTGIYDYNSVKNIKFSHINNYFSRKNESYTIADKIKNHVDFSYYNLLDAESSSPSASIYGDFDLVICCNVLFYYKPEIQEFIISKIRRSLKPKGYFITGEAETAIVKSFKGFKQYVPITPIFVKT